MADDPGPKVVIGTKVVAWNLSTTALNGATGYVTGRAGDRIAVDFGSRGKKSLKPENILICRTMSSDDEAVSSCCSDESEIVTTKGGGGVLL